MHIAITASDVSAAAINHVDDRVAANDDTIAQPHVDAAANMDPAATHGGGAADYRLYHTAAIPGSDDLSAAANAADDEPAAADSATPSSEQGP